MVEEKKEKSTSFGFGVSGCPLWVFQAIAEPAKVRYNNVYWVRIVELLHTEEAYHNLLNALDKKNEPVFEPLKEEPVEEKEEKSPYMGSRRK